MADGASFPALLGGRLAPLTFSVGFLEQPLGQIADVYLPWTRKNHGRVTATPVEGDLATVLSQLEPLVTPPRRTLFVATASPWTAYFDNGSHGPDPRPPISYLALQLRCRGLHTTCVRNTMRKDESTGKWRGVYGAVQFEMFARERREFLNCERAVGVTNDGRWIFDDSGTPQPFEESERYSARKITDRFTPEMLERYCAALGIRLFDETFYSGPGWLVVTDKLEQFEELPLAEARRRLDLE
jgi:hypothetical protein